MERKTMGKILLVIGDGAEATDTLYPFFRLQEEGYSVVLTAPEKRVYHLVIHDRHPDWDITVESQSYLLESDIAFRDVRPEQYRALVLSGRRAPEYLRYDPDLIRITRHFFDAGKPVACVCHEIEILSAANVIKGRQVTTVPKCRYDAEFSGATYLDQPVVRDGNLITAQTF